jgi:hypothetical protein
MQVACKVAPLQIIVLKSSRRLKNNELDSQNTLHQLHFFCAASGKRGLSLGILCSVPRRIGILDSPRRSRETVTSPQLCALCRKHRGPFSVIDHSQERNDGGGILLMAHSKENTQAPRQRNAGWCSRTRTPHTRMRGVRLRRLVAQHDWDRH